jgi:peroxiredoxin
MKYRIRILNTLLYIAATCLTSHALAAEDDKREQLQTGDLMPNFILKDYQGKSFDTSNLDSEKSTIVVFFGVECPLVKFYVPKLVELVKTNRDTLQIIGLNSNRQDSISEITKFASELGVNCPLLKDPANRVADAFGASRTPEVFLFNLNQELVYHGAIDDRFTYGKQKFKASKNYLADAVKAIENQRVPKISKTETDGCLIGRVLLQNKENESNVTYANQISRILNERCVNCHRDGEAAPFSLTDYDEVVGWAEMIDEVVKDQRMPPWHANPQHGKFKNDPTLSTEQKELISEWVKAGAPLGDKDALPTPPKFTEGWRIGEPDVVFQVTKKPYPIPAVGVLPYKYFQVKTNFKEDKWVQSAEVRIGNRAVVHHVVVIVSRRGVKPVHGEIGSEWLTAAAPGSKPLILTEGLAKVIPAGATLIFQVHYTPNGTPQTDLSSVGFKFVDKDRVRKIVGTKEVSARELRIPAWDDNYEVSASREMRQDAMVLAMFPHMHWRGKSFRYTAKYPDGRSEVLLDVPKYDFNWQNGYEFEQPKLLPRGTEILCEAVFDNSAKNFANPAPEKEVRWGDQTFEEMMIGYFDMVLYEQDLQNRLPGQQKR